MTNHTLDLRCAAFEAKLDVRFAGIDARFATLESEMNHRVDRFEHELLAQVDRRWRAKSWVTISWIIAAMGTILAAIKL